jgi:hypothetical protein
MRFTFFRALVRQDFGRRCELFLTDEIYLLDESFQPVVLSNAARSLHSGKVP